MKRAVVVATHDGLISLSTGVGVVTHNFIEAFDEIKKKANLEDDTVLICLSPFLKETSKDFREELKNKTAEVCSSNNGHLVILDTLSDGNSQKSMWRGLHQWSKASESAAKFIEDIKDDYDSLIVFAHDTIFAGIRKYIPNLKNVKIIWVPHSLGYVFDDEYTDKGRINMEKESIDAIRKTEGDFIGYIGSHNKKILHERYNVEKEKLKPLINGVFEKSDLFNVDEKTIEEQFKENNIPSDKKIIFCWGRCTYQKGYDLLIPAFKEFYKRNTDYHIVLVMPTETTMPEYLEKIKGLISELPEESVSTSFNFNNYLCFSMFKRPNLEIIVFPSRFEGAPLTPLEAIEFADERVRFVYSPIPQMKEIFGNNKRGIMFDEFRIDSICDAIEKAKETLEDPEILVPSCFVDNYVNGLEIVLKGENECV